MGLAVVLLATLWLLRSGSPAPDRSREAGQVSVPRLDSVARSAAAPVGSAAAPVGSGAVSEAFHARRSNVQIETVGMVLRVLSDDREGSRHERFIVRVEGGVTVLVAHNIDLAPRVPVAAGDSVVLSGEYEWNPKGGVVHWTHHDPDGRHPGGWIRHEGRLYQ